MFSSICGYEDRNNFFKCHLGQINPCNVTKGRFFIFLICCKRYIRDIQSMPILPLTAFTMYACSVHCCQTAAAILTKLEAVSMATPCCRIKPKDDCVCRSPSAPPPNKLLIRCNITSSTGPAHY